METLPTPWSQETTRKAGIGPAHPAHPRYAEFYTPDGIRLTEEGADLRKLSWVGVGEQGYLGSVAKPATPTEGMQ